MGGRIQEIVSEAEKYKYVLVSGPQRSGTTIASKIFAKELGYAYVDEYNFEVNNIYLLYEHMENGSNIVIQSPAVMHELHNIYKRYGDEVFFIIMKRDIDKIIASQEKIDWGVNEYYEKKNYRKNKHFSRFYEEHMPISMIKYRVWEMFQKDIINKDQWTYCDYKSLSSHNMFVPKEKRKDFEPKQTEPEMEDVDIVMLADSKTPYMKKMTRHALETLYNSEEYINFKVYLVESNDEITEYEGVEEIIHKNDEKFNFNKFMNIGRKRGNSKYVALVNNDVIFKKNWASTIINFMEENPEVMSASPFCENSNSIVMPDVVFGYEIIKHIAGWCIFQQRKIYEIIGDLDEQFNFWYADNDYGETLKKHNLKHAKLSKSVVNHKRSKTLSTHTRRDKDKLTKQQTAKFRKKWNK